MSDDALRERLAAELYCIGPGGRDTVIDFVIRERVNAASEERDRVLGPMVDAAAQMHFGAAELYTENGACRWIEADAAERWRKLALTAREYIVWLSEKLRGQPGSRVLVEQKQQPPPIAMLLWCPTCGRKHVDEGEWATRPHKTHLCENCGRTWRHTNFPTVGVAAMEGCA